MSMMHGALKGIYEAICAAIPEGLEEGDLCASSEYRSMGLLKLIVLVMSEPHPFQHICYAN
jgi:hypothetical protein